MSETPTPQQPARPRPSGRGGPDGKTIAAAAAALAVLAILLALVLRRGAEPDGAAGPSPTRAGDPSVPAAATRSPPPAEPAPAPSPQPSPAATTPVGREPTDGDAAAFAAGYAPPGEQARSAVADVDGDGRDEVVFASISAGVSRVDVAAWDGRAYRVVFVGQGGRAERLDAFFVSDFTGDRRSEIVTVQSVGAQGQSLSVWGHDGREYRPQAGRGGCWDGSHIYGVTGARIEPGRITATCDAPGPLAAQPSDVYEWDGRAWAYARTESPGG